MATKRVNGEGSIRKKIIKGKTYWEGRYTDAHGKQRSVSAKTQSEVRSKLNAISKKVEEEKEYAEKERQAREEGRMIYSQEMTLNEWYDICSKMFMRDLKPQTVALYSSAYINYFKEAFGDKKIKYITEEELLYLYDTMLSKGLAQNTIVSKFEIMSKLFNKAIEKKIISANPLRNLKLRMGDVKNEKRALTMEEMDCFFKVVHDKYPYLEPLFVFMKNTGCRIGEAIVIEWKDISDDMRFCTISKTKMRYYDPSQKTTIIGEGSPKNHASIRIVPLNDAVKNMLIELKECRKKNGLCSPETKVFLSKRNKAIYVSYICEQLERICEVARECYDNDFPKITSHWFRHTFASYGVEKNIPSIYLQRICGWTDGKMLSKIYAHMNERQALEAVQDIYSSDN